MSSTKLSKKKLGQNLNKLMVEEQSKPSKIHKEENGLLLLSTGKKSSLLGSAKSAGTPVENAWGSREQPQDDSPKPEVTPEEVEPIEVKPKKPEEEPLDRHEEEEEPEPKHVVTAPAWDEYGGRETTHRTIVEVSDCREPRSSSKKKQLWQAPTVKNCEVRGVQPAVRKLFDPKSGSMVEVKSKDEAAKQSKKSKRYRRRVKPKSSKAKSDTPNKGDDEEEEEDSPVKDTDPDLELLAAAALKLDVLEKPSNPHHIFAFGSSGTWGATTSNNKDNPWGNTGNTEGDWSKWSKD